VLRRGERRGRGAERAAAGQRPPVAIPYTLHTARAQVAKADADRHRKLVQALAADVAGLRAGSAAELVEFARDADARLAVVVADEAAVLAQFPAFPKARAPRAAPASGRPPAVHVAAAAAPGRLQSRSRVCQARAHSFACVLLYMSSWRSDGQLAARVVGLAAVRTHKGASHKAGDCPVAGAL